MQISGCGQVSVSCVQAVSPIAQGAVQTVSTIANGFYYYCTKHINSFSYCTAGRANRLCYCNNLANCFYYNYIKRPNLAIGEIHVGVACKDRQGGKVRIFMKALLE